MVDLACGVDVNSSMQKKMWSTEEFQHVLAIHTEQVHSSVHGHVTHTSHTFNLEVVCQ